jgi:3-dehydroshikimate dehydratase
MSTAVGPQVCCCSIAFRDQPLAALIPRLAQLGFDGIEAWGGHLDRLSEAEVDDLRCLAEAHGCPIRVVSPYFFLTRDLPELEARSLADARRFVALARRLGATRVRTFVDAGPDGLGSALADDAHWRRAIGHLRTIAGLAPDLRFVIETHVNTLADTPAGVRRLVDGAGQPNLRVLYQPGPEGARTGWRRLRGLVEHVHLQRHGVAHGQGWLEEDDGDLAGLLACLRDDGYTGTISVEYCWSGATWERVDRALEWVRRQLAAETAMAG